MRAGAMGAPRACAWFIAVTCRAVEVVGMFSWKGVYRLAAGRGVPWARDGVEKNCAAGVSIAGEAGVVVSVVCPAGGALHVARGDAAFVSLTGGWGWPGVRGFCFFYVVTGWGGWGAFWLPCRET